eukprot:6467813-Ditylum_brightwellii.AAC.1
MGEQGDRQWYRSSSNGSIIRLSSKLIQIQGHRSGDHADMDGNEEDIEGSDLCKFYAGLSLVSVHLHLHPDDPPLHTYI